MTGAHRCSLTAREHRPRPSTGTRYTVDARARVHQWIGRGKGIYRAGDHRGLASDRLASGLLLTSPFVILLCRAVLSQHPRTIVPHTHLTHDVFRSVGASWPRPPGGSLNRWHRWRNVSLTNLPMGTICRLLNVSASPRRLTGRPSAWPHAARRAMCSSPTPLLATTLASTELSPAAAASVPTHPRLRRTQPTNISVHWTFITNVHANCTIHTKRQTHALASVKAPSHPPDWPVLNPSRFSFNKIESLP
jgi:hypothetical protein